MQIPDYYQTLGDARGAMPENLKKVYRKLARRYHPDVSKEKEADRLMKEVNEAFLHKYVFSREHIHALPD